MTTPSTESAQGYLSDPRNEPCWSTSTAPTCRATRPACRCSTAGFVLGDGVWEGLRLVNGRILSLSSHLDRLLRRRALDRRSTSA
jgi:branched-chain amino acid aminotransferase